MTAHAYVINLPRSTARRAGMVDQLERLGLQHEFIEAVDGRTLTPAERAELVDETAVAASPHWLTPGTIGCALSHLRTYQRILENSEEVGLILEDDAILPASISNTVAKVVPHMHGSEVVLLYFRSFGACRFSAHDMVALGGKAKLAYPMVPREALSAVAYLITREACQRLAETILPVRAAADTWGYFYELGAIESIRCVIPRSVGVRRDVNSTTTHLEAKSMRMRAAAFATRQQAAPVRRLLTLNRHLWDWRMGRTRVVPQRSPIAISRPAVAR